LYTPVESIECKVEGLIRVVIFEPYPMGLGGNYQTQRHILERLDRERFYPIVVAPMEGAALKHFREMGVECVVLPPPDSLGHYGGAVLRTGIVRKINSVFDLLRYNFQVSRFLRQRKIDVIYANCVRAELSIGLAAVIARVPSLLYIKGELANPLIDRVCFVLASRLLFFCSQNRDDKYPLFLRWFREKIGILKIGLDPELITRVKSADHSELRNELDIDPGRLNVAVSAQLYRPKGQHLVLEALSKLIDEFPHIRLYFLGDHVIDEYRPYKLELERLVGQYGLGKNVRFTGWRSDALDIVSQMDIIIHPSLSEGFGRAVLESMALAKPVIASAVGGLREAIRDGQNGFLVKPGDVSAITSRWKELANDPELRQRLGEEARRTVFVEYLIDDKITSLADTWIEMGTKNN